jgi:hypothetical protein
MAGRKRRGEEGEWGKRSKRSTVSHASIIGGCGLRSETAPRHGNSAGCRDCLKREEGRMRQKADGAKHDHTNAGDFHCIVRNAPRSDVRDKISPAYGGASLA